MASKFDYRSSRDYATAAAAIPQLKHHPHVTAEELREIAVVVKALPSLKFPVNSAGELLDALGSGKTFRVHNLDVDPARMIKYMPAYYFPVVSYENLVEKMVELVRANRQRVDTTEHVNLLRKKISGLRFPIASAEDLRKYVQGVEKFPLGDRSVSTQEALAMLPRSFFPVRDQNDLERKVAHFLNSQPLIQAE